MALSIHFTKDTKIQAEAGIIALYQDMKLSPAAAKIDRDLNGLLSYHIEKSRNFKGKAGQVLGIALPPDAAFTRMVLLGLGAKEAINGPTLETVGAQLIAALSASGFENAAFLNADDLKSGKLKTPEFISHIGYGAQLGAYRFDEFKTGKGKDNTDLKLLSIVTTAPKLLQTAYAAEETVAKAVHMARDLVNKPPNVLYPETYADFIKKTLAPLGVKVTIFNKEQILKMGMGCFTAVGQASEFEPRLVIMEWPGNTAKSSAAKTKGKKEKIVQPLAFVGKGMTYDCGGLAIKPAGSMTEMKGDMAGSAAVVGLMQVLAARKCKVPVIGAVALAENAISDEAYRNDDILTSLSGKTVEVLNTDAEGRLVLCDTLTYVQQTYNPKLIIDLATLTGAIIVSLGHEYAGAFVNDNALWRDLEKASGTTGEKLWRMPLDDAFRRDVESPIADLKNIGSPGAAGSCTAAAFLEHFIDNGRPWAHLDIAGTGMTRKTRPTHPRLLGTGFGIRVLDQFIKENHE